MKNAARSGGPKKEIIPDRLISTIAGRLADKKRVRRTLPMWGRLHIDRQLPFLIVYRRPRDRDDEGTERLVLGEASYVQAPGQRGIQPSVRALVRTVARTMEEVFGAFLILEVWSDPIRATEGDPKDPAVPGFRIVTTRDGSLESTVNALEKALRKRRILGSKPEVELRSVRKLAPPGLSPLLSAKEEPRANVHYLGLEIRPIYRDPETGQTYPRVLRAVHRQLSIALKQALFEFTRSQTTHLPPNYQALGRRAMVKAVWEIDRRLAEISNSFDFLLYTTPSNPEQAWTKFKRGKCEVKPDFVYRPLPIEPGMVKRDLYEIPIERIEDPVVAHLFIEQRDEFDRKLTMLADRGTPRFLYGSLQLFGAPSADLLEMAKDLLKRLPRREGRRSSEGHVNASEFAQRAAEELDYFRLKNPAVSSQIQIRSDISGLMVSRGNLLIGDQAMIPRSRVEALIQHEVGTHVLTYLNGRAQPFKQLYSGLAGYEELQEGIAVLAEFLVGGLTRSRMRLLAARVVAVLSVIDGATFVDTYRLISDTYRLDQRSAFAVTMRVHRSGGLTKDVAYLRGLVRLIRYLNRGGEFEPLLVGKIAEKHVPVIQELRWRKILRPPPLRPRYLEDPRSEERLKRIRDGVAVHQLIT